MRYRQGLQTFWYWLRARFYKCPLPTPLPSPSSTCLCHSIHCRLQPYANECIHYKSCSCIFRIRHNSTSDPSTCNAEQVMNLIAYRGVAYIEKQVTESVLFPALPLVIRLFTVLVKKSSTTTIDQSEKKCWCTCDKL